MSFIAMYGVSVIFNYVLSNVVALIDTIIDKKYEINNIVAIVVCALYFFLLFGFIEILQLFRDQDIMM